MSSDVVDCIIVECVSMISRPLEDLVVKLSGRDRGFVLGEECICVGVPEVLEPPGDILFLVDSNWS